MNTLTEPPPADLWAGMTRRAVDLLNGPPKNWGPAIGRMDSAERQRLSACLDQLIAEAAMLRGYLDGRIVGWPHATCVDHANQQRARVRRELGYRTTPAFNIPEG